jgi:peptidoglycan/xylan/chitin deacetylase (PgdA/CDA1 family)
MLGLGVEAAIRHSRHLGGARRTLKRAYVLEAEQSGTDATQRVRAAYVGPPFAVLTMPGAKLIWRGKEAHGLPRLIQLVF